MAVEYAGGERYQLEEDEEVDPWKYPLWPQYSNDVFMHAIVTYAVHQN
jgi:hypothetical protein